MTPSRRKGTVNRGFRCPDEVWEPAKDKAAYDPALNGGGVSAVLVAALRAYVERAHDEIVTDAGNTGAHVVGVFRVINGPTGRHAHVEAGIRVEHEHDNGTDPHPVHVLRKATP